MQNSNCLIQYVFPNTLINFTLSTEFNYVLSRISYYSYFIVHLCEGTYGALAFVANIGIFIWIIAKLIIRRNAYTHVNDMITRPLMERYRKNIGLGRNYNMRPPFIQAFRSQLIY